MSFFAQSILFGKRLFPNPKKQDAFDIVKKESVVIELKLTKLLKFGKLFYYREENFFSVYKSKVKL